MSPVSEFMSPKKIAAASDKPGLSALDVSKLMIKNGAGSVVLVDGRKKHHVVAGGDHQSVRLY